MAASVVIHDNSGYGYDYNHRIIICKETKSLLLSDWKSGKQLALPA